MSSIARIAVTSPSTLSCESHWPIRCNPGCHPARQPAVFGEKFRTTNGEKSARPIEGSTTARATPLLLKCELASGANLMLCGVHTKSKFSQLKSLAQWNGRDSKPAPVLDALTTRQKLSAEVARLRSVLTQIVATGLAFGHVVALGDFNDGPFADVMEAEFLIGNILDELVGSFLEPNTYFKHAMEPERLSSASTTRFRDPLKGGQFVEELIDHILLSPGIWSGAGRFRLRPNSCVVESVAWDANVEIAQSEKRQNRPSDHKPVSVVIEWDG